ncbi:FitA-like ribbon-helix-helix domain-containing protein [Leekyejoonella antrihumi]|uniref:Antitoxin n=1 Tax=Leekyejoonella antrihumi TaxID=1660198 RepID=A0A563E9M5_9MICO|nr:antitoxin [Leekyejoonella antrihumi]TWP38504.1 antitoxin [Leekyejoonella antrihumi]
MVTVYIRDVDEATAETLKQRAAAEGRSVSAYVASELRKIAARPTNAQVVERLRNVDRTGAPSMDEIVEALESSRR